MIKIKSAGRADAQRAGAAAAVSGPDLIQCGRAGCTSLVKDYARARYRRQSFCRIQSPAQKLCASDTKKAPSAAFCRFSA